VWAFATGAARDAADGAALVAEIVAAAGVPVEILSGEREARLAYAAAARGLGLSGALAVIDIGGRTSEITLGEGETVRETSSLPLGALTLTERYLANDPPLPADLARLGAEIDRVLSSDPVLQRARGMALVASGGTATALAALDLRLTRFEPERVHGHVLARERLAELSARLGVQRVSLPALDAGRAAILPAGARVLERIVAATGAARVQVSQHGVRHAYLQERLAGLGVEADLRALWR
jgi:exopolyphosphatase/guanosine-5'-triphosphate,3'-diphosphate pyrophosphatase